MDPHPIRLTEKRIGFYQCLAISCFQQMFFGLSMVVLKRYPLWGSNPCPKNHSVGFFQELPILQPEEV